MVLENYGKVRTPPLARFAVPGTAALWVAVSVQLLLCLSAGYWLPCGYRCRRP